MPNLQLQVFYEVEGMRVDADALGSTVIAYDRDGITVRVVLPDAPDGFVIPKFKGRLTISNHDPDPREDVVNTVALLQSGDKYEIRIVRAIADTNADTFQQIRDQLLEATASAVTDFTEQVWVLKGQTWNAPSGEYPKQISPASLFNLDDSTGGTEVGAKALSMRVIPPSTELSKSDLDEISRLCVVDGRPSLPELLLAEGRHFLWRSERLAPDRAVLMAAIACELTIKTALRELADPEDQLWVDLVIKNPTDVSVAAANLWNQAMKAATGHSLSVENGGLYRRLEKLIAKRNGIVHRDEHVTADDAKDLVGAAVEAFDWLRTIHQRGQLSEDGV
jgi:hypothetical protein